MNTPYPVHGMDKAMGLKPSTLGYVTLFFGFSAAAFILSKRLPVMMGISCLIGIISSIVGLYISYYANVASGAAIVLTATTIFLIIFLFSPERGIVWSRFRRRTRSG